MTINEYVNHYIKTKEAALFLIVTLAVLLLVLLVLFLFSKVCVGTPSKGDVSKRSASKKVEAHFEELAEEFYELIFAGGSILGFLAVYYLINRFYFVEPYRTFWDKYNDFLLLLLIVLSIVISRVVDGVLIRLKRIKQRDKSAIRLVSMLYMILIFCYIKFIYENNNYDSFISYFLGLMIGRFVYFDTSFKDFWSAIKDAATKLPIMILALATTAILSFYGFKTEFLIKHIGVVTNVFFIHIYMSVVIFFMFHIYHLARIRGKSN